MGKMGVSVVLDAEDRARGVLDQFGRTVIDLSDKTERGLVRMDTSMARTTRGVRALAIPLMMELSPALSTTSQRIAGVTTGALMLGSGLTALGLAAAGIAGVIGGQLLQAWRKNREELEQFNRALTSMNVGKIEGEISRLNDELERTARDLRRGEEAWDAYWQAFGGRPTVSPRGEAALGLAGESFGPSREATDEALANLRRARRAREAAEEGATFGAAFEAGRALDQQRGRQAADLVGQIRAGAFEIPFIDDPVERAVQQRRLELQPQIELLRERGLESKARRLEAIPGRLGRLMDRDILDRARFGAQASGEAPFAADVGAGGPLSADDVERIRAFQRREFELDLVLRHGAQAREEAPFAEAVGAGGPLSAEDARRFREDAERRRREPFEIGLARARLLEGQEGLSRDQRDALTFQRIEAQRAWGLSEPNLTSERRGLVALEADVSLANLARVRAETTEAAAGLAKGFQDVEDEFGAIGLRMQDTARGTAANMHRAFSDSFFSVVTGDFKKLPEISRQFGQAMVRTIIDELSKLAIAPIFRQLRGGFGGAVGVASLLTFSGSAAEAGGAVPIFAGVAGGGGGAPFITAAGGTAQAITMSGASAAQAAAIQQQGLRVLSGPGRVLSDPGGLGTFGSVPVPITALLPNGQAVLIQTSGVVVPISGGLAADVLASTIMQSTYDASGNLVTGLGGATVRQALSVVGGAIGLGLTVYSALQGPPTAENILMSAASGALSGAIIGSAIPVIGTAIGAIAGGIIGGGAAAFGKGGRATSADREAKEVARHAATTHGFINEINAATSLDTLYATLRSWQTGAVGGTSSLAFDVGWRPDPDHGYPTHWNYLGLYANASPPTSKEFFARFVRGDISKFYVNVQAGVAQSSRDDLNVGVREAILGKLSDLVGEVLALIDLPGLQQFLGLPIGDHPLAQSAQRELAARLSVAGVRELQQFLATTPPEAPLVAQVQGRLDQLLSVEARVPIGFETLLADGTLRRTGLPGSVVDTRAGDIAGREILTLRAEALRPFFEDDQLAESFLARLLEIARDRQITFLTLRQAQAF